MNDLNDAQRQAVLARGHTVVVACPGSGKTRVLIERAARLHTEDPSAAIVLVTFTRQAAGELRSRLAERLSSLERIRVATFHALALQQLLSGPWSRICGPAEQRTLLRAAALGHVDDQHFHAFLSAADAYTSGHLSSFDEPGFQDAYDQYLELMLRHKAVDVSQAIQRAVELMADGSLAPLECDYLLVDEVQDIDPAQIRWVRAHTDAGAELTIVGDDDQSIYAFRFSAGWHGMQSLQRALDANLVHLSINYRSRAEILGLATLLISRNRKRLPKSLYSARGEGGLVRLHAEFPTEYEEALGLLEWIRQTPGRIAVIARTNRKLDRVAEVLDAADVQFSRTGRRDFWELEDPALLVRVLRSRGHFDPMLETALASRIERVGKADAHPVRTLADSLSHAHGTDETIRLATDWLITHMASRTPSQHDSGTELLESACRILLGRKGPLQQRLTRLQKPRSDKEERVVLCTMHGAKGREWQRVWLFGCQDGLIPHRRADLEEERRLFYVAMTRAELELNFSCSWNQPVFRNGTTSFRRLTPSRFLSVDLGFPLPARNSIAPPSAEPAKGTSSETC